MGFISVLLIFALIGFFIYRIFRYFNGRRIVSTDELYQQNGITINYNDGTIKIGKHLYKVDQVTGIKSNWQTGVGGGRFVKVEVDDLVKPIHHIPILSGEVAADRFMQRLCVALRKAGGPSFI